MARRIAYECSIRFLPFLSHRMSILRRSLTDAWQFFVAPFFASLLPWPLAWRWLRRLAARDGGPFDEVASAAATIAPDYVAIGDHAAFAARVRLIWLLDAVDLFLSLTRVRRRWRPHHVGIDGTWPRGAFVAIGFHHGTGHWTFKSLAEAGHRAMFVSARWHRRDYARLPLRYWYGCLRGWDIARLGASPIAFRPGAKATITNALAVGTAIVAMIDIPPRLAPRGQKRVHLLGRQASLPTGLLALAHEAGVPVVPYWSELDLDAGTRRVCIGAPLDPAAPDILQMFADYLDAQIRRMPEAWHFWPEWPRWIDDAQHLDANHDIDPALVETKNSPVGPPLP